MTLHSDVGIVVFELRTSNGIKRRADTCHQVQRNTPKAARPISAAPSALVAQPRREQPTLRWRSFRNRNIFRDRAEKQLKYLQVRGVARRSQDDAERRQHTLIFQRWKFRARIFNVLFGKLAAKSAQAISLVTTRQHMNYPCVAQCSSLVNGDSSLWSSSTTVSA